jgi:hypothetical protein
MKPRSPVEALRIRDVGAGALLVAVVLLIVTAGEARAPEPARLTASLSNSYGAAASAVYANSTTQTSVVRWPGSWAVNTTLKAGTPCSTFALRPGQMTTQVIHAQGNYRKCQ